MKKTRAISLLLSLSLICAMLVPGAAAFAENESPSNSGMVINKTATANDDGSYTITLEAYATGSKVISEVTEDVPTDIVLVLDQSGSMEETMSTYDFREYTGKSNSNFYDLRHNGGRGNLYHKLENGSYATVSVTIQEGGLTYTEITNGRNNYSGWNGEYTNYWNNQNNLYAIVNGEYQKVTVSRNWSVWDFDYTYTYKLSDDDTIIATSTGYGGIPSFSGVDGNILYVRSSDASKSVYTYTYTDANGVTHTIGTSTGADTRPTEFTLYERYQSGSTTRLNALKTAVTNFADAVAEKAAGKDGNITTTEDNINHRIAVVGFASGYYYENGWDSAYYYYDNTEVFVGATQYTYNAGGTNNASNANSAQSHYSDVFQSMDTTRGQTNITASIGKLDANGGTLTNLGMEMANGILNANPVPEGEQRNRVIIVFTDGAPGWSGYDSDVASDAITQAQTAKDGKVTVYTVGIFSGADATSAGNEDGDNTEKANWFMQKLSSNDGKVQTPSYYLSAADAGTLNSIFQQISDQIESGGSSTTLSSETVIRDIIAPAFTLPAGASASDIVLETWHCTGKDGDDYTWSKNADAMGATVTIGSTDSTEAITTNNQVNVTGFDFAGNYVGTVTENGSTTYRGDKLVIKITVEPREGFFGGNGVDTNTSAGVYENEDATDPVLTFPKPDVNVPLEEPTVVVPDANVYLGAYYSQTVPEDAVKMGATVTIAGYDIDFSKANDPNHPYGLEPWQVKYVNISIAATTEGNGGSFENIQEDITYTVTVTVSPKTPGPSGDQSATDTGEGTIHVFKPQLTYQDSQVWYGGDEPTDYSGNLTEETWINSDGNKKHDDEGVQMLNTKPELTLSYTPEAGKITTDGKVNTKQDIGVNASVKIGENDVLAHTTFQHTNCEGKTCTVPEGKEFLLHVNTCQLTITKQGGTDGEPYVFTVKKDGTNYTEVTIVGNGSATIHELPVGTYTIEEDTGWSWRFTPSYSDAVTLSKNNASGTISCTNTLNEPYWLNGFSAVVKNVFGIANN